MTETRSRRRRRRQVPSSSDPAASPDLGVVAKQAVVTFLRDASMATAEREAARRTGGGTAQDTGGALAVEESAVPGDTGAGPSRSAAESEAWRAAAMSMDVLDQIEAAAARMEADIAAAVRAHEELRAGAADAAAAAVSAAESALAAAGATVRADKRAKVVLRRIEHYVALTVVILIIAIVILTITATAAH